MRRALAATWVLVLGFSCSPPAPAKPTFGKEFLWGAAVAGFQVDMGCPTLPAAECDDPHSDWYDFISRRSEMPDLASNLTEDGVATGPGHWELYEQDFDLAKNELGLNSFRFSLEWSRIFPSATDSIEGYDALKASANPTALAKYHAMLSALKARGIKPLVTLNHYTLPTWIHDGVECHKNLSTCTKRGWLDRERIVKEIAKYAGFCAKEFGADVDLWATQNEPFAVVLPGYLLPSAERLNPPAVGFQYDAAKDVMVAMIEAHARMYDAVKANDPGSTVGLVYATTPVKGKTDSRVDKRAAENVFYLYNTAFLDGVAKGDLDAKLDGKPVHRDDLANRLDFIGINYYGRTTVTGTGSASLPTLSMLTTFDPTSIALFEDYPKGLYEIAMFMKTRYGLPTYVTETGAQVQVEKEAGASWLVRHAIWVRRAINDGADVRGFFYWTLMDNFEWNHGMGYQFGLYAVDKADPLKKRVARTAVAKYREITKANDVPKALEDQFPPGE